MRFFTFGFLATAVVIAGCRRDDRGPLLAGGREVKSWVAALNDPRPAVRRQAVLKLGNVGDADPAAAVGVASALHDPDKTVRRDAVHAIVKFVQPAAETLDRLREMSRSDPDLTVRDFAGKALAKLDHAD